MKKTQKKPHLVSLPLAQHLVQREGFRLTVSVQLWLFDETPLPGPVYVACMSSRTVRAELVVHSNSQTIPIVVNSAIELITGTLTPKEGVIHTL